MTREEQHLTDRGFEGARSRLVSIASRLLGSRAEAEDVVQDAWLKWQAADRAALRTPLAWLTTVTTRLAIDRLRRLQTETAAHEQERLAIASLGDATAPSAEEEMMRASLLGQALAVVFDALSSDERAAFVLHEAFDCDYQQIASAIGKTPAHCRQLVHRARQRLQGATPAGTDRRTADAAREPALEALASAIETCDVARAIRVFAGSAAAQGNDATSPAESRPAVAALAAAAVPMNRTSHVTVLSMRGETSYLALVDGDVPQVTAIIVVSWRGDCIRSIDWLTDAAVLRAIDRLFGATAVRARLARPFAVHCAALA
ncbi:sigma-70 family RNA polymerase sigma factor [Trinickia caryophylli]|uniref:RNA polymerase sigma-70 factor, ECF subfamily n=1 Tax=Trinickia caryophylli TaxID=28094 RepID=A0A1X7H1B6_TRICW|nr:sigma-70 family RNA polymerase sigma factor [Trinickia caryophylli]WQE10863.1 sigma-70 family RNA polymerase sigma factor [Trinickia caryophylli]GLU35505.1 hypothetical protein Busp01_53470 [Trinickia caryophylli]SMF78126.1 RNA polymerase sigma-70 factor, ECF subfamily [Trinickia caryophylli]